MSQVAPAFPQAIIGVGVGPPTGGTGAVVGFAPPETGTAVGNIPISGSPPQGSAGKQT